MRMRHFIYVACCVVLVACGGIGASSGDAARGAALFSGQTPLLGDAPACSSCHLVQPGSGALVGPSLANVGTLAASRVGGESAEDYLRASILTPDAYVVDGFQDGIMYKGYSHDLTSQQIDDLVAYLLTLKSQ